MSMARVQRPDNLPAAPIDLRAYGVEVDPQLAFFRKPHLVVALVTLLQATLVTVILGLKRNPGYVRRNVVAYCAGTIIFSLVYAFTGHTTFSNFLAVAHNHWEVQLISISLVNAERWTKFRRVSLLYYMLFACLSLFASVKTGRRLWTMFGIIYDGMLPITYGIRHLRAGGGDTPWKYGFVASVLHLLSILILLSLVDDVAQYFSLLVPPTCIGWAFFVVKYESRSIRESIGVHRQSSTDTLPGYAFFLVFLLAQALLGIPAAAALYGERFTGSLIDAAA